MHFDELNEGDYRIYAGAIEAPKGAGYVAAVVVNRLHGVQNGPREAWRDSALAGGHRWTSPDDALSYAMTRGKDVIREEPHRLAC